jgi:glycosyltransferase involved in cell wall biosynthesis
LAVPITIGGGVRVKVLEALAAGKAIVATPRAAEGIGVRAGRELIVAENEDEFVASSARLLNDSRLRASLARSARDWAERELSWATMANRYNELYARLERRSPGHGR